MKQLCAALFPCLMEAVGPGPGACHMATDSPRRSPLVTRGRFPLALLPLGGATVFPSSEAKASPGRWPGLRIRAEVLRMVLLVALGAEVLALKAERGETG